VIIRQIGVAVAVAAAGCASAQVELAGVWIDYVKTTTSDSSMWVLTPSGTDRTLANSRRPA
jgi:hypothetical protein